MDPKVITLNELLSKGVISPESELMDNCRSIIDHLIKSNEFLDLGSNYLKIDDESPNEFSEAYRLTLYKSPSKDSEQLNQLSPDLYADLLKKFKSIVGARLKDEITKYKVN